METIPKIIYDYLATNRRVTVAGLGTFLTKGDRESVLFSEFMKSDDGTLRALIAESGLDGAEADAMIESFVAQVKSQTASGGEYDLSPMGVLSMVDGAIVLQKCVAEKIVSDEANDEKMIDSIVDSIVDSFMPSEHNYERYSEPSAKFDVWMVAAISAGAIALFALLYGVAIDWMTGEISFGRAIDGALESMFR